ncbi:GMC family oxidoreductase [Sagittula sp. SSi028]|uniref:GMC family oxidoreductase n=1 Tax=Sagittula sp. SSi028 TaxID=3400636 RepID=UPI003AF55BFD
MAETYDYVIVGAGSAGCVLAERLSASGRFSVLVLEAGGSDRRFWIKVPVGYAITHRDPALNWGDHTQADAALQGRSGFWPRGKVVGGSGSINAMAYVRGLPQDFDDWQAAGAEGWNWQAVRETYDRIETQSDAETPGGPVWVQDLSDQMHPFSRRFLEAARDAGFATPHNMNGEGAEGITPYRSTVRRGVRWSSADAFLRPALKRDKVRLINRAHVTGLNFDGRRVTGLSYERKGVPHQVYARQEVILSAGAINSPQILQMSGVGPASLLRDLGIEVRHDLPHVGANLQDHLAVSYQFRATTPTLNNVLGRQIPRMLAGLRYLATRRGPLAVPVNQMGGFVRSHDGAAAPDMQLFCNPASYDISARGEVVLDRTPGYLLSAQPCRPTSRGSVMIRSADPYTRPAIDANSLATEQDRAAAVRGVKLLRRLADSATLQAVTRDCKTPGFADMDDDALLEDFRARSSTVFHPTCTCRMGRDASGSVIDGRMRVHGLAGVRVVDASAFPNITSGNTNAPTMMLALRAADLILQDAS